MESASGAGFVDRSAEPGGGLLDRKIAIVAGGASGIGHGIARGYAREGASVIIADIDAAMAEKAAAQIRAEISPWVRAITVDVADADSVGALFDRTVDMFGAVDIVVNSAYLPPRNLLFEQKTTDMVARTMTINFGGTWRMMQAALPHLRRRGGGRIISFCSIEAKIAAWLHADYSASKAAIEALTRTVAAEWARFDILVNCISPAARGSYFEDIAARSPEFARAAAAMNPLRRIGHPESDIAPAAVFLASCLSRYVTGQTLHVDGGIHIAGFQSRPDDVGMLERERGVSV